MRPRLRRSHRLSHPGSRLLPGGRTVTYGEWEVLPEVGRVADGELFGGTWQIRRCSFGRPLPLGYEVRILLGDNDHFATRREAVRAALLRAKRTIEAGEVGAVHLSAVPARSLGSGIG